MRPSHCRTSEVGALAHSKKRALGPGKRKHPSLTRKLTELCFFVVRLTSSFVIPHAISHALDLESSLGHHPFTSPHRELLLFYFGQLPSLLHNFLHIHCLGLAVSDHHCAQGNLATALSPVSKAPISARNNTIVTLSPGSRQPMAVAPVSTRPVKARVSSDRGGS